MQRIGDHLKQAAPLVRHVVRSTAAGTEPDERRTVMADLETAIGSAVEAHRGQKDRAGAPFILPPLPEMFRGQTGAQHRPLPHSA
jgi:hypothetical protein